MGLSGAAVGGQFFAMITPVSPQGAACPWVGRQATWRRGAPSSGDLRRAKCPCGHGTLGLSGTAVGGQCYARIAPVTPRGAACPWVGRQAIWRRGAPPPGKHRRPMCPHGHGTLGLSGTAVGGQLGYARIAPATPRGAACPWVGRQAILALWRATARRTPASEAPTCVRHLGPERKSGNLTLWRIATGRARTIMGTWASLLLPAQLGNAGAAPGRPE